MLGGEEAVTPRTRKVMLRSAMTMSADRGGVFDVLLGLTRWGLGGTSGDGRQYVSGIHEVDLVRAVRWLIEHEMAGAVNLAAPGPVPNREFMRGLRRAWGTRVGLPATRWMLEVGALVMGTEAELMLKSRRVVPGRLLAAVAGGMVIGCGAGMIRLLVLGWLAAMGWAGEAGRVDVYSAGEGGYHSYRIPALVQTKRGTLLAFAEGRRESRQDWGDIDVLVKRSRDGGRTWSAAIVVADLGKDTIGNPAPVVDRRTGTVWLLLTRNPGDVPEKAIRAGLSGPTRTVWVTHSKDDGLTWAPAVDITAAVKEPGWSWYATGPVNGIQTKSGRLVIPCDHDRGDATRRYSHVIYSDDGGATWRLGGSAGPEANESTVAELEDGSLLLNMRSYRGRNRRMVARSRDEGLTWSEPVEDAALVEPVCQGSLLRFGRKLLLFSNPASTKRENLTVRVSRDGGRSWYGARVIQGGPAAYSNLVALDRGTAGILYERGEAGPYEQISFARFAPGEGR